MRNYTTRSELLTRVMRLGLESRLESLFFLHVLATWLATCPNDLRLDLDLQQNTCDLTCTCNKILATWLGLELWPTDFGTLLILTTELNLSTWPCLPYGQKTCDLTCPMDKRLDLTCPLDKSSLVTWLGLATNDLRLDLDLQKMTCIHLCYRYTSTSL